MNHQMKSGCAQALFLLIGCFHLVSMAEPVTVEWEVLGRFRLVKDSSTEDKLFAMATAAQYVECAAVGDGPCSDLPMSGAEAVKLISQIAPFGNTSFSSMPVTRYNATAGRYEDGYAALPKEWLISLKSSVYGSRTCRWLIDETTVLGQGNCQYFRPTNRVRSGQVVKLEVDGQVVAVEALNITDILVVGMGDSFASGEGMPDVTPSVGWPFGQGEWLDEKCHRSLLSAQALTAARLAATNLHRSVTFVSRACSGAEINELYRDTSLGLRHEICQGGADSKDCSGKGSATLQPQLKALRADLCPAELDDEGDCPTAYRQPDLVLLAVGGNDGNFAPMIFKTVLGNVSDTKNKFDLIADKQILRDQGLKNIWIRLPGLARALLDPAGGFPAATVIHVGYPNPMMRKGREASVCVAHHIDGEDYYQITDRTGFLGLFFWVTGFRGTHEEYIALHNDFVVPLTGSVKESSVAVARQLEDIGVDGFGLRQASLAVACSAGTVGEAQSSIPDSADALRKKSLAPECNKYWVGKVGFDKFLPGRWQFSLARNETEDLLQLPGFVANGFCLKGTNVRGRWFNVLGDSLKYVGSYHGSMHPNIFGQLFLANRTWVAIPPAIFSSL